MKRHVMKFTHVLVVAMICTLMAEAQKLMVPVTLDVKETSLEKVFAEITKQTKFNFVYSTERIEKANPVTFKCVKMPLNLVLDSILQVLDFTYSRESTLIIIRGKETSMPAVLRGVVVDIQGLPIPGVTVENRTGRRQTSTDANGSFYLVTKARSALLKFTCIGFEETYVTVQADSSAQVVMRKAASKLDDVLVVAYGVSSERIFPGAVKKIDKEELKYVADVTEGLRNEVAGLHVATSNGLPSSSSSMEIRGSRTIDLGNFRNKDAPYFLIDNVPFPIGNKSLNQLLFILGDPTVNGVGINPLLCFNPHDIESIQILKDAVATSIYGAKAANGAILITTKRGQSKGFRIDVDINQGYGWAMRRPKLLNTDQYLDMIEEARQHSGTSPEEPGVERWGKQHYTDMSNLLLGGIAKRSNSHVSFSYGKSKFQILINIGTRSEYYVLPVNVGDKWSTGYINTHWSSPNSRIKISSNSFFSAGQSNSIAFNILPGVFAAPNIPQFRDRSGNYLFSYDSVDFENPLAWTERKYNARTNFLLTNMVMEYSPFTGLKLKANFGFSRITMHEESLSPMFSLAPTQAMENFFSKAINEKSNSVIEPQINYNCSVGNFAIGLMAGNTFQREWSFKAATYKAAFESDSALFVEAAKTWKYPQNINLYAYKGQFLQIKLNWENKIITEFMVRKDGSSRFSSENSYGTFMSAGILFNVTRNDFKKWNLGWIHYLKLSASIGKTGNEISDDYKYINAWTQTSSSYLYAGYRGLVQQQPYIKDYKWESTIKRNLGIKLVLFEKFDVSADYYSNLSDNQLVSLPLSSQAGFNAVEQISYPVEVINRGFELTITKKKIDTAKIYLVVSGQLTFPSNKLHAFPDQERFPNYKDLIVGESLQTRLLYKFKGIDKEKGIYLFEDMNGDGRVTAKDKMVKRNLDVKWYGNLSMTFGYQRFSITIKTEFRYQPMFTIAHFMYNRKVPGAFDPSHLDNQPEIIIDRWRKPGDNSKFTYVTTTSTIEEKESINRFVNSDAAVENIFYGCLRSIVIDYNIDKKHLKKLKLKSTIFYISAQNLLLISNRRQGNPTLSDADGGLPALAMVTTGIKFSL